MADLSVAAERVLVKHPSESVLFGVDFGKLLALGPTLEVLKNPDVQKAYLGNFDDLEVAA